MLDMFQRILAFFLTMEVVGILATMLAGLGISPMYAGVVVILLLMLIIHKVTSDRYMFQRWRRKLRGRF